MRALVAVVLILGACADDPVHSGKVTDRWGKPVAGAVVGVSGSASQIVSGEDGRFTVPVQKGDVTVRVGKPGFIKQTQTLSAPSDDQPPAQLLIALYPDPDTNGFYAVGTTEYTAIGTSAVKTVGTELRAFSGLVDVGTARVRSKKAAEFVFSSDARRSELKQLGLQLNKLKFVETTTLPGVLGETPVQLNMWVADAVVAFDLTGMETDDDYSIKTREPLEPGMYAFHTQGILTSVDSSAMDKLPSEMRIAFPFEVR